MIHSRSFQVVIIFVGILLVIGVPVGRLIIGATERVSNPFLISTPGNYWQFKDRLAFTVDNCTWGETITIKVISEAHPVDTPVEVTVSLVEITEGEQVLNTFYPVRSSIPPGKNQATSLTVPIPGTAKVANHFLRYEGSLAGGQKFNGYAVCPN
jgi:hypothetical protein